MLTGNVVALLSPLIFVPILTYFVNPQNYDWQSMKAIRKGNDHDIAAEANVDLVLIPGEAHQTARDEEVEQAKLKHAVVIARLITVVLTLVLLVLWPIPMYASEYIFSKPFFTGWVVVAIIWTFCSAFCVGLYPLWDGRYAMVRIVKAIFLDVTGKRLIPLARARVENTGTWTLTDKVME